MKRKFVTTALGALLVLALIAGIALADRQTQTVVSAPGSYASSGTKVTMTAADTSNYDQFLSTGKELVIAHNTDSGAHTVTITSVADEYGRTGNISQSVAANSIYTFGPFKEHGWEQTGGYIYLQADSTTIEFGVIKVP